MARIKHLMLLLAVLLLTSAAWADINTKVPFKLFGAASPSATTAGGRFVYVSSSSQHDWQFLLDRHTGEVWRVFFYAGYENVPVFVSVENTSLPEVKEDAGNIYQLYITEPRGAENFLLNTSTGEMWQLLRVDATNNKFRKIR